MYASHMLSPGSFSAFFQYCDEGTHRITILTPERGSFEFTERHPLSSCPKETGFGSTFITGRTMGARLFDGVRLLAHFESQVRVFRHRVELGVRYM